MKIVIVDDHEIFRDGLRAVLNGRDGIVVVADHGDAEKALAALPADAPDVVLMDLHLRGLDGIAATRTIKQRHPAIRVVVLSMLEDAPTVRAALASGADGYVTKSAPLDEILAAIQAASQGRVLVGAEVAEHIRHTATPVRSTSQLHHLTLREQQLLHLLADGASTEHMAIRLGIAEKTVRNYLSGLYLKLGARDRTTAALASRRLLDM